MYSQRLNEGGVPEAGRPSTTRSAKTLWRVLPIEGAFELSYCNEAGNPTLRRVIARELKIGPGKTILGAIDMAHDGYRGFRADRIARVVDAETGEMIERNVLDWLTGRAERQAKAERKAFLKAVKEAEKPGRRRETNPL
jgi:predicted DNA-binding transcriptional regulator YafY